MAPNPSPNPIPNPDPNPDPNPNPNPYPNPNPNPNPNQVAEAELCSLELSTEERRRFEMLGERQRRAFLCAQFGPQELGELRDASADGTRPEGGGDAVGAEELWARVLTALAARWQLCFEGMLMREQAC